MRGRKELYVVIGIALILVFIIFGIVFEILTQGSNSQTNSKQQSTAPTPIPEATATTAPSELPTETETITPTEPEGQTAPPVTYDQSDNDILLERVENRRPLSNADLIAKGKILALLPDDETSGVVYDTERVSIEYVNSADAIMIEIRTTNIDQAKAEAVLWLQEQGFTQEGICYYPVQFYLNFDVAQQLSGSNIVFSPLAPGCK